MGKRKGSAAAPKTSSNSSQGIDSLRRNLVEAPTFTPTESEFQNPLRYILSIREEAEKYGICCIKPPPSWKPPFMLDLNKLKFPTRVQKTNELLVRKVQRLKLMKELTEFWDAKGTPLVKIPAVAGTEIDLHLLYTQVKRRGGFERASAERRWTEIAENMNMHNATTSSLASALKKHYEAILLPYERVQAGLDAPPPPRAAAAVVTKTEPAPSTMGGENGDVGDE